MGGPNGGDGGTGGNAYIYGDPSYNTLLHLKFNSTMNGDSGAHGQGKEQRGRNGANLYVQVPLGTQIYSQDQDGNRTFIADVVDSTPHLVAEGGEGGWGNTRYVSSTNQEPVLAQRGERGEAKVLFLELKLLADVGLLARPNAGKSTLISRCSGAKPKIASYPFTTVEPVLGAVSTHGKDFVMMEVPGLLEGAHRGVGLGHEFLRHAERARIYVHVIDGLAEDPVADLKMLNNELRLFSEVLSNKRQIIAVNKMDVTEVREKQEEIEFFLREALEEAEDEEGITPAKDVPIMFISAVSGEGVPELLGKLVEYLSLDAEEVEDPRTTPEAVIKHFRPAAQELVYKQGDVYRIESEELERMASMVDLRDQRVILQLWREMTKKGLARRLADLGIEAGDTIRIGRYEVEWF
jgi:GTP-binding protein